MKIIYSGPESEVMVAGVGVFPRGETVEVSEENHKILLTNPNYSNVDPKGGKK